MRAYLGDEPDDDIPDMSTGEWFEKFKSAPVRRGRPKSANPKVLTTIRLDPDVLERVFRIPCHGVSLDIQHVV